MKRIVIASLLGLIALPALATSSLPFEQTQFDRMLPTVAEAPSDSISVSRSDDHNRYNP